MKPDYSLFNAIGAPLNLVPFHTSGICIENRTHELRYCFDCSPARPLCQARASIHGVSKDAAAHKFRRKQVGLEARPVSSAAGRRRLTTAHLVCPPRRPQIVARNSYVDETLFGCSSALRTASPSKTAAGSRACSGCGSPARSPAFAASSIVGRDGTMVLSKSQLDRMMQVGCEA